MKFINYLETITGISIYPMIALLLFTSVFVVVVINTLMASKQFISENENIPLN